MRASLLAAAPVALLIPVMASVANADEPSALFPDTPQVDVKVAPQTMQVEGTVTMDPAMLEGGVGFVYGCGITAPIDETLHYSIVLPVFRCDLMAFVVNASRGGGRDQRSVRGRRLPGPG